MKHSIWKGVLLIHRKAFSTGGLRVAYFGTDEFSVRSLDSLVKFSEEFPNKIDTIDVITRSVKPRGRKSKQFVDLPIGTYYNNNSHRLSALHRVDSKEDILSLLSRRSFDLAIAISFGLLIPEKFLNNCRFGGLNVHPSLLPKYSGSSPIQYALLNNDKSIGCTVQTLHPTKFDHGNILLQSDEIPIEYHDDYLSLNKKLATKGADLLRQTIEGDLYKQVGQKIENMKYAYSIAPKIPAARSNINWSTQTSQEIISHYKALGPLYTSIYVDIERKKKKVQEYQRVTLDGLIEGKQVNDLKNPGDFKLGDQKMIVKTIDGSIEVAKLKMQCYNYETPIRFYGSLGSRIGNSPFSFKYT